MRLVVLFLIGLLCLEIGIRGNLGSLLGAFITPDYMQEM